MMKIHVLSMILLAATTVHAGEASSQHNASAACNGPEFHQFDFWIGNWEVSSQGQVVGHNTITPIADGCALLENWTGADDSSGKSINAWRPTEQRWTQHWVGSGGTILDLTGGLAEGRMVLTGPLRQTPKGPVLDRITWTPVSPNEVRQVWELSSDDGAVWSIVFDGTYTRRSAGARHK